MQSSESLIDNQTEIEFVADGVFGDVCLDVLPDLLVGVELRGVRRQVNQFETTVGAGHIPFDELGLVNTVTINDEDDGLLGIAHELLQELHEDFGVDRARVGHELHGAIHANGRDHLYRDAVARSTHDGRLSRQTPGGAAVVVAAHTSLVSEEQTRTGALSALLQGAQVMRPPLSHEAGILLPSMVQGALRAKAQVVHDFADGGKAELDLEFALNELGDEAQRPQAEFETELCGHVCLHQRGQALELRALKLRGPAGHLACHQGVGTVFEEVRRPLQHRSRRDSKQGGNLCCRLALTVHLHRLHTNPFLFLAATGEDRSGV